MVISAYRAAAVMIENYGDDARVRAVKRADELAAKGDKREAFAWRLIIWAIGELQRARRKGDALN
jgi:hypothetical protein